MPPMPERSGFSSRMRSKNSPRRPSRIEYVIASSTPASVKSGTTSAPRGGTGASLRWSRVGGIERAGLTTAGRGGATCLVGIGDGTGSATRRALAAPRMLACVLRAGVVARERVTAFDFEGRDGRGFGRALWLPDRDRADRVEV